MAMSASGSGLERGNVKAEQTYTEQKSTQASAALLVPGLAPALVHQCLPRD